MPVRAKVQRASAQRRRESLLKAASYLSAEIGAGAVTHRAVAARAGVPLSTTSYFFGSIDELVTEALRAGVNERVSGFDASERAGVMADAMPIQEVIEAVVDQALDEPRHSEGSQVEFYLAAGRQPELQAEASAVVSTMAARVSRQLDRTGAPQADDAGWAVCELGDGAMLHRLAEADVDHRERLSKGLRLLMAAAMLRDDEIDDLLARYEPSEQSPQPVSS